MPPTAPARPRPERDNAARAEQGPSAEHLLDLVEEPFGHRVYLFSATACKLFEQFALPARQLPRRLDDDPDQLIAAPGAAHVGHAFALQAEHGPRLRSVWDFHLQLALQGRDVDLGAQRRLCEADRNVADDVVLMAREQRVLVGI